MKLGRFVKNLWGRFLHGGKEIFVVVPPDKCNVLWSSERSALEINHGFFDPGIHRVVYGWGTSDLLRDGEYHYLCCSFPMMVLKVLTFTFTLHNTASYIINKNYVFKNYWDAHRFYLKYMEEHK